MVSLFTQGRFLEAKLGAGLRADRKEKRMLAASNHCGRRLVAELPTVGLLEISRSPPQKRAAQMN